MFNLRKSTTCVETGTMLDSMVFNSYPINRSANLESDGYELSGKVLRGKLTSIYVDVEINLPRPESRWDTASTSTV